MMAFAETVFLYVVPFILVLGLIITIHELGHFLTAKWFGVAIDRFSIGFGRAIFSRRDRSGVEWRLGWIPLGGYVRFAGDENDASVPDQDDLEQMRTRIIAREGQGAEKKYLPFKPLWQRTLIVAAGPIANFLLATVIFAAILMSVGEAQTDPVVTGVQAGSPAADAGFQPGDHITRVDGHPLDSWQDLTTYVMLRDGRQIDMTVLRGGQSVHVLATPRRAQIDNGLGIRQSGGRLGLDFTGAPSRTVRYGPVEAIGRGAARCWTVVDTTLFYIGRIVTGQVSGDQIGGPIQTITVTGAVAQASASAHEPMWVVGLRLLSLAGFISVSVGFFNLLPIPALDGGHLLFYAYEAVARRPLAARVQAAGYRVGLALLLCLMLFATWNDLQRLRVFQSLGGLFS